MDRSKVIFEEAVGLLPGGVSSPVRAIKPYPFYARRALGSRIIDVDGREYIDYCMAYGPLLLGHGNPEVKRAVVEQLELGWLYGTPVEAEVELAREIAGVYPGVDMVRFVSTGTEATMGALRVARGYTGRDKIIKIEGGFHGAHDAVLVKAGSGALTHGTPDSLGVPVDFTRNTLQVPFNDIESLVEVLEQNQGEVACLIMEPVMGNIGPILPEPGYLEEVRKVTREHDVVLIFDEVITGFRLALGGAQEYYGVTPDMTTLGKVIGGGFPIGVIGGEREIMENISPAGEVYQAGTFNGSPVSLAAGLAVLNILKREGTYRGLEEKGEYLRESLQDVVADLGLSYSVVGVASMFKVFMGEAPRNYQEALRCDREGYFQFTRRMLEDGVFLPPSQFETEFISTAHTQADLEKTVEAFRENLPCK